MRRFFTIAFACAILGSTSTAYSDSLPLPTSLNILGIVTAAAQPVEHALVIALNLSTLEASETFSSANGGFSLPMLPAAVYRIIAIKPGFNPTTTMIIPTQKDYKLAIRLDGSKSAKKDSNQEIWELRGSLPPDILRELDMAMASPVVIASNNSDYQIPRIKGEMVSMTGVADQSSNAGFAQTALGVQSRIGDRWQLGFRGNLHRIDDPNDGSPFGNAIAESSTMQMELRSSGSDAYRVASTKSWWRYRDMPAAQQQGDISTNNLEWEHGDAHVQVRYLEQQNLFAGNPGSDRIEIAGNTTVMQTQRSDIGVELRVSQESLHNAANATFRTADLTANGNLEVAPAIIVKYGMSSRMGLYGAEWAPRSGAEWKLSKDTSFVISGLYKVYDQERQNILPSVVMWSDESSVLPRYAYSFGFVSGDDKNSKFSAIATVSAADSPLRVVFTDGFEQFWDGLYIDTGDVRHDLRLAYRKEIGRYFLVDISSSAGSATPRDAVAGTNKVYVTGDVQSTYYPSGTTLAVSYRQLHQPQQVGTSEYRTERMNVRVSQDLHLPLALKVLLGIEVARAENSPFLLDSLESDGTTRKYIGGLAVNF
ncbi:MAG TPA: carboxypeptidase-like regulatory domain-containing protein [Thermoanaerobaculia bacterium]|nr:carboxypeptidase-like regulatory domain-containing protein [Thermoanaerobaculia bacterium]